MPRPRQRNTHNRQRQRLIEACISALHIYGPSRTTVEKVVAIAKLSPGIVRFYFASKAAMLVASLQFLATEFEEQVLAPVSRLKDRPVAALRLLVELYLDPELASPRKVSVWYAFWGEASSRQEYYDICGQKDEGFAALVREIIERLISKSGLAHLDADGVALGLIGVLEMLWQEIAFKEEVDINRQTAKERAMAYLRSVFPGQFTDGDRARSALGADTLSAWTYDNPRLYAMERERIFQNSWQLAAHAGQLKAAGDFLSTDLGFERALLLCGEHGELRAFRNSCPAAPHALLAPGSGRQKLIRCAVHGFTFALDGASLGGATDLVPMDVRRVGDLVLVRVAERAPGGVDFPDHWQELTLAPGARSLPTRKDAQVAADWKILAELFLGLAAPWHNDGWSVQRYQRLTTHSTDSFRQLFLPPNQWISLRPDGWTLRQVLPLAPGRCSLREYRYTRCEDDKAARAAEYLAERSSSMGRASAMRMAESIQHGVVGLGLRSQTRSAEVSAFHRQLLSALPLMALDRPASEP
jgi:TetR/AcrR family transcriptional repressor of bet genes